MNQGATCYLNSLLQTLFMTREFRTAVFQWEYRAERDGPKETCIPYQLQVRAQSPDLVGQVRSGLTQGSFSLPFVEGPPFAPMVVFGVCVH